LIAALNKYFRPISKKEFWYKMDIPGTNNAIAIAQFPKEVEDWIFQKKYKPFQIFK